MKRLSSLAICAMVAISAHADKPIGIPGVVVEKPAEGPAVRVADGKYMVPYVAKIPGTDMTFEMVPVPAGTFLMGSPDDEADREESEGPQIQVNVAPMWVGKHEVTWQEYDHFRELYDVFTDIALDEKLNEVRGVKKDQVVDTITAPTPLYEPPHTFEFGHDPQQAAVSMTQYAAQHYTKWLSAISGQQYRLPTEAEWEYACRGQTTTAYSWGDDPEDAEDHAWFYDNAPDGQSDVGEKTANPFGLYDMHGNAAEWTVNKFTKDGYAWMVDKQPIAATEAVKWPTKTATESVLRGGTWQADVEQLRSAARMVSADDDWKEKDPNFPQSPWWFTSDPARGVGLRLFRSYEPLDQDLINKFWDNIAEDAAADLESRLDSGKGKRGLVDKDLPDVRSKLNE